MDLLSYACEQHSVGMVQDHPTVLTCWDAYQLDLWCVGIIPKAKYRSTETARSEVIMAKANRRAHTCRDVYDARHDSN
jgi:hypothetical protein